MKNILQKFIDNNKYICIHTDTNNLDSFIYGKILCIDDKFTLIYTISPKGIFDGVVAKLIDNIIWIEVDSKYEERMCKLCPTSNHTSFKHSIMEGEILESVLNISMETKGFLSIELLNSGENNIVGFVSNIKKGICEIMQVDLYGIELGVSYVHIADITQISFMSTDEMLIYKLWESNNA